MRPPRRAAQSAVSRAPSVRTRRSPPERRRPCRTRSRRRSRTRSSTEGPSGRLRRTQRGCRVCLALALHDEERASVELTRRRNLPCTTVTTTESVFVEQSLTAETCTRKSSVGARQR
eukprot:5509794-Pleurochrysis_carterae.AAC.7